MSTSRIGKKWADVEEEEEDGFNDSPKSRTRFETQPDKDGVKTVIEYNQKDGKTFKVTKKVKLTVVTTRTNHNVAARKDLTKFGKVATLDPVEEKHKVKQQEDEIFIELSNKLRAQVSSKDDMEDKWHEESLAGIDGLVSKKKVGNWVDKNRERQLEREAAGVTPAVEEKPAEVSAPSAGPQPGKYLPPSMREPGKGGGKGDMQNQQDASLRVTNLSEDVREGDLQDLFGQFGRLARVFLAKDQNFQSRGFAFVTYYNREDAQRAINKLNGHGYDNLILQVQFAKPRP